MGGILIGWLLFSFIAGAIASNKGNSFAGAFLISILLSPIIGIIIALVQPPNEKEIEKKQLQAGEHKKCPYCAEIIKAEAVVCRFCGRDVNPALQSTASAQPVKVARAQIVPATPAAESVAHDDNYFDSDGGETHGPHTLDQMQPKIEAVMRVLSVWNPLGERAAAVSDLDNYRTQATDILFHFGLSGGHRWSASRVRERASEQSAAQVVQDIISQAFDIEVLLTDCQIPAAEIWHIYRGEI